MSFKNLRHFGPLFVETVKAFQAAHGSIHKLYAERAGKEAIAEHIRGLNGEFTDRFYDLEQALKEDFANRRDKGRAFKPPHCTYASQGDALSGDISLGYELNSNSSCRLSMDFKVFGRTEWNKSQARLSVEHDNKQTYSKVLTRREDLAQELLKFVETFDKYGFKMKP